MVVDVFNVHWVIMSVHVLILIVAFDANLNDHLVVNHRMQLHRIQQQLILLKHVLRIFAIIMVYVNKLPMEQAYNVIVQRAGQVHDVNTVYHVKNIRIVEMVEFVVS